MKQITVRYYDTFRKESFCITADENLSQEEWERLLDDEVTKRGYSISDTRQIYLIGAIKPTSEEGEPNFEDQPFVVVYTNIICPHNAQEFDRDQENGIRYFFHTDERNHIMNPHIHAQTDGNETMSFALNGKWVAGMFKSPSKAKKARKYIRHNRDMIKAAWDAVIYRGYPLTRKEIEQEQGKWLCQ